eukprot:6189364-Pleurochrysis_carterae.AAC.1
MWWAAHTLTDCISAVGSSACVADVARRSTRQTIDRVSAQEASEKEKRKMAQTHAADGGEVFTESKEKFTGSN